MADDPSQSQEKTEQPTAKRLKDAADKGQVLRSKEFNTTVVLITAAIAILFLGPEIVKSMQQILTSAFDLNRDTLLYKADMLGHMSTLAVATLNALLPLLLTMVVAALIGPLLLGGIKITSKSLGFKFERMDPIKGLKKLFAVRGLVELLKALAKFIVIAGLAILILWLQADKIIALGTLPVLAAMSEGMKILSWSFLFLTTTMLLITAVDVPFQMWDHMQKLKMTKQEIKDEMKESEGRPEVKGAIRRAQQEISSRRMMEAIPKADVVVTNPDHYAVALKYDQDKSRAPRVVAKGADHVAIQIKKVAKAHNIIAIEAPPLARAIFHSTELNYEIPEGLYVAVAQVLAYVYQLKKYQTGKAKRPKDIKDITVPVGMDPHTKQ